VVPHSHRGAKSRTKPNVPGTLLAIPIAGTVYATAVLLYIIDGDNYCHSQYYQASQ
jgi:hypothetical protein